MARRAILLITTLWLAGCGESVPPSLAEQGATYLRQGKYDESIKVCDKAIGADSKDAKLYLLRGRAFQFRNQSGDAERAISDFTESIKLSPQQSEAYYLRSIAYRDHGDINNSIADEKEARRLDSSVEQTYSHLPDTSRPLPVIDSPPAESSDATAKTDKEKADELNEYLRLKQRFEGDSFTADSGGAKDNTTTKDSQTPGGLPWSSKSPFQYPGANNDSGTGSDLNGLNNNPNPNSNPGGSFSNFGQQEQSPQQRGLNQMGAQPPRSQPGSSFSDQLGPAAPTQPRGRYVRSPYFPQAPVQSPFPQQAPRPTGLIEDPRQSVQQGGTFGSQPRQNWAPYQVRPFGTVREDSSPQ